MATNSWLSGERSAHLLFFGTFQCKLLERLPLETVGTYFYLSSQKQYYLSPTLKQGGHKVEYLLECDSEEGNAILKRWEHLKFVPYKQELICRESAKEKILDYTMRVVQEDYAYWTQDDKSKLLTSYGVKGTGKTAVMRAMVGFDGKPGWIQTADPKARAVTSSFNESGDWVSKFRGDYKKLNFNAGTAFGRHILRYNGMCEEDVQRIGSMETAVFLLRKKLGQTTPGTLVIGVDEFAMLEEAAGRVLVNLVQLQGASIRFPDEYGGPVVFIMSALTESFFSGVQIGSGRPVLTIRLHNLPQAKAFDLLPADIRNAAKKDGRIQNLINQCGGNPRALFEGVVNARDYLVKEGQEVYDSDIAKARSTILKWCNVTSTIQGHTPMDIVSTWFAQELTAEWRQTMRDAGLLQPVRGEYFREIFFPLMLAEWSSSKKLSSLMSHHIAGCYDSDDQMMTGQGKRVEEILMHYAVVRKLAYHHLKMDSLIGVFFNHSTVSPATKATDRKCKELSTNARLLIKFNETSPNLVRHVSKFTELADGDWNAFRDGHTLYSDLSNEKGIEYITPHFRLINGKSVLTAEVCQIKYTTQSVDWPNWQGKLKTSPRVRVLNKKKIPWFAVYYASHSIPQTYKTDCIHFPKDALDKFTAPLGTLRLHLGKETPESPLSGAMLRHRPWVSAAILPSRIPRVLLRMF